MGTLKEGITASIFLVAWKRVLHCKIIYFKHNFVQLRRILRRKQIVAKLFMPPVAVTPAHASAAPNQPTALYLLHVARIPLCHRLHSLLPIRSNEKKKILFRTSDVRSRRSGTTRQPRSDCSSGDYRLCTNRGLGAVA